MKPSVLTVDSPGAFVPGRLAVVRSSLTGDVMYAVARRSGRLSVWPASLRRSGRTGHPWSRPLSDENRERLENARRAVYGTDE